MIGNREKNFISLVVYVHDDEKGISAFLEYAYRELQDHFEKFEIICVNDASADHSGDVIKAFKRAGSDGVISLINMSYYQGLEAAMNAGTDLAIGDFVFEFDTALLDFPEDLMMKVYWRALSGYDIVNASPGTGIRLTSRIFYGIYNKVSRGAYKLRTERFRLLSRRAINRIHSMNKTIPYRKPVYANCGLRMDSIEYSTKQSVEGRGNLRYGERNHNAITTFILFTNIAYQISIGLAVLMMMAVAFIAVYACTVYFGNQRPIEGWTTTMLFLSLCFWAIFALFAIVIKYLSIILDLMFRKRNYLIDSIEKL